MSSQRTRSRLVGNRRAMGSQPVRRNSTRQNSFDLRQFMGQGGSNGVDTEGTSRTRVPQDDRLAAGGENFPPLPTLAMPGTDSLRVRTCPIPAAVPSTSSSGNPANHGDSVPLEVVMITESESSHSNSDNDNDSDIQEISDSDSDINEGSSYSQSNSSQQSVVVVGNPRLSEQAVQYAPDIAVDGAGAEARRSQHANLDGSRQTISQAETQVAPSLPPQPGNAGGDSESDGSETNDEEEMETDLVEPEVVAVQRTIAAEAPSSQSEFKTPKKVSAVAVAAKMTSPDKSDDEGECCPICFESWTTSGAHRLVSLKCGHLFGQSCIDKWLRGQGEKCPHCNLKAKRNDIRVIYAKGLKVLDTTERDHALEALEKEKEARKKAEFDAADIRVRYELLVDQHQKLKVELDRKQQQIDNFSRSMTSSASSALNDANKEVSSVDNFRYMLDRRVEISKNGGCRVMTCSLRFGAIIISQPSVNSMFPGFGVKKLSTMDFKTTEFVHIHSKMIRDLAFHPTSSNGGLLLSCAVDKMLKITSMTSNTIVQSYEAPAPIWSCCWHSDQGHLLYAGLVNGRVLAFDTRKADEVLDTINSEGSHSAVVALHHVPRDVHADFRQSGLLVGQMNRTSFFEELPDLQHKVHMLPLEGTLASLNFEPHTRHILATFRSTAKTPLVRHLVCELASRNVSNDPTDIQNVCTCRTVQTLQGGNTMTMLSRSQLYPHPDQPEKLLVCAGDEATTSAKVWDASVGQLRQKLTSTGQVVDTFPFTCNNNHFLATLAEKSLAIYKGT